MSDVGQVFEGIDMVNKEKKTVVDTANSFGVLADSMDAPEGSLTNALSIEVYRPKQIDVAGTLGVPLKSILRQKTRFAEEVEAAMLD